MAYTSKDLPAMREAFQTLRPTIEAKVAKRHAMKKTARVKHQRGGIHKYFQRRT
jgi:hypothetical protein